MKGQNALAVITARKRSLRRLCFYRCLSVHTGGDVRGFIPRGACVVLFGGVWFYLGGMRSFIQGGAWFYLGGCAWFYSLGRGVCVVSFRGACMVLFGGYVWSYSGGHAWFYLGGMRGFIWGACVVLFGGACMVLFGGGVHGFFSFFGYNEIRSMSGRYASYWNAFLLLLQ